MKVLKAFIKPYEALQRANQLIGFYMRATLALNGLKPLHQRRCRVVQHSIAIEF